MIEAKARVVRTDGVAAYVEAQNASSCGACSSGKACGVSLLGQMFGGPAREFRVLNPVGARTGDSVVIGLHEHALLKSSLVVYLLPLLLLFAGTVAGLGLAPSIAAQDIYSIAGGAVGLILGFAWVRLHALRLGAGKNFQPVILRKENHFYIRDIKEA